MDIKTLTDYCLSKKGSHEDYHFSDDVMVIKVASKMFALLSNRNNQLNISLKCDPFIAENLRRQYTSVIPGYHLNKSHWNTVIMDDSIPDPDLFNMIDHSYELVLKQLKKFERDAVQETSH